MTRSELRSSYRERLEQKEPRSAIVMSMCSSARLRRAEMMMPKGVSDEVRTRSLEAVVAKNLVYDFRRNIPPQCGFIDLSRDVPRALTLMHSCMELSRMLYEDYDFIASYTYIERPKSRFLEVWQKRAYQYANWRWHAEVKEFDLIAISQDALGVLDSELDLVLEVLWGKDLASRYQKLALQDIIEVETIAEIERVDRSPRYEELHPSC